MTLDCVIKTQDTILISIVNTVGRAYVHHSKEPRILTLTPFISTLMLNLEMIICMIHCKC